MLVTVGAYKTCVSGISPFVFAPRPCHSNSVDNVESVIFVAHSVRAVHPEVKKSPTQLGRPGAW